MTGEEGILRGIQEVLNAGYGDQATSALDRIVAVNIVNHLRRTGWMNPVEVSIIIQSAGGQIIIPEELLVGDVEVNLTSIQNPMDNSVILTSRRAGKVIPGEIVDDRPTIEHREVHSGPIKVSPIRSDDSSEEAEQTKD